MRMNLLDKTECRRIADLALSAAKADHTLVSISDENGGTARIANNQIVQNVESHRLVLQIESAFGLRRGAAVTTELSDESIRETVARSEAVAKVVPEDPEYLPPLEPRRYPVLASWREETAAAGAEARAAAARTTISAAREAGMTAAGIVSSSASAVCIAANSGLFAFERRTRAEFSLTATAADSSGWVQCASRSFDDLDIAVQSRIAIDKARRSAAPRELPAGKYTVILEPAAVAGLIGPLFGALSARSYQRGTSPLRNRFGEAIVDERLTLRNRPDHPQLLGDAFDTQGLASDFRTWIDRGRWLQMAYDRFTARQAGVAPSYALDAPHLSGEEGGVGGVEDLIASTERGILVTNFWYIRSVNATDLTLTGMTRDGTFLVEDGKIAGGLVNFRWHDSPLRALRAVEAFTAPLDAITAERDKMMLPAMRIRDFNFSSVTRF
ncbi:MAG: TldD/PmbA family protein [Phycisphaerales bacterium]|nr:TldD/PmbA family protein [Phycisphaerales bacterium]